MKPKISVIVPVRNVETYLMSCADSVRRQTWKDWELLLVDDGSTDGSGALCDALAATDRRIRVLRRPQGGVGAARNAGLDAAAGEYVTFLDADDAYAPEHLATLLKLAETAGADVAATGVRRVDETGAVLGEARPAPGAFTGRGPILDAFLRRSGQLYACWNKLFRREIVGGQRFSPYILAEDALFCVQVLARSRVMAAGEDATYRYLLRPDSATERRFHPGMLDQLRAWEEIYDVLVREAPALCPFAAGKLCHDADRYYPLCRALPEDTRREAVREVAEVHRRFYLAQFEGKIPWRKRAAAALYRLSPELYYRLAGN